jgi:hypothetical protein
VPWIVFGVYLFAGELPPSEDTRRGIVLIAVFLVNLYLYEIAYKITTPKSLLIHHVSTMLLVILAVYRYQYNGKVVSIRGVFTLGLTALTEQSTFLALILYRVRKAWCLWPLLFAAAFTLISKSAFLAWTIQIVIDGGDEFWYRPTTSLLIFYILIKILTPIYHFNLYIKLFIILSVFGRCNMFVGVLLLWLDMLVSFWRLCLVLLFLSFILSPELRPVVVLPRRSSPCSLRQKLVHLPRAASLLHPTTLCSLTLSRPLRLCARAFEQLQVLHFRTDSWLSLHFANLRSLRAGGDLAQGPEGPPPRAPQAVGRWCRRRR